MQKKHSTDKTNVKTHKTIRNQWSVTFCGTVLLFLKSKKDAKKGEVNVGLDILKSFHEGTGA